MDPSYSPLFTLGLLADRASAIYFTLERDPVSFLYLDHPRTTPGRGESTTVYEFARPKVPATSVRHRTSKDSLPLPKPAPSTTLPDLPTLTPPSLTHRPVTLCPPTPRTRRPVSLASQSISSHDRRKGRMHALACLEGRRIPRSTLRNNFMSFSDDEDERAMARRSPTTPVTEDLSAFADVEDEADTAIPPARPRKMVRAKPARPGKTARRRRGTLESWFPLKSFIDLKDDDLSSWNWRSFIEIGGVS